MSLAERGFLNEFLDAQWERRGQLPLNEKKLSMATNCNPRSVRSVLPRLLEIGVIIRTATGYYTTDMMCEILGVDELPVGGEFEPVWTPIRAQLDGKVAKNTAISTYPSTDCAVLGGNTGAFEPNSRGIRGEFAGKVPKNPMFSTREVREDIDIDPPNPQRGDSDEGSSSRSLRAETGPVPTSLPEVPREAPMPAHVKPVMDWRTAFGTDDDHAGIELQDGRLVLVNGTRSYWLDLFGGNEVDLDLALRQVRGWVNSGSRKSLKAQVEAGLARIAQERRQRSANYQEAARRNRVAGGNVVRGVF